MTAILLVEDDAAIAEPLSYALKRENWEVIWCAKAGLALEYLSEHQVDFMILDVGLPDMDGFELCRKIRKTNNTPLLFLTARTEEIERIIGLEIGADDYCAKPFSPRELISRIKAILRRTQTSPTTHATDSVHTEILAVPVHPDDVSLHPWHYQAARQQVSFNGQALSLTRNELNLLVAFLRRPNWVLSREQLMQAAWAHPDHSLLRTVDTHIKTLRQKLKTVDADQTIVTHRGLGYELRH
ncbi:MULTISPECIES: response regulator [Vitreoscilla]|uniref:Response regulator n=1 Tax=Vitreoscilla stercoraria TaxID=61 RepID=A0ABY4E9D9_VITST|nr:MULTISPECIES: response regulator [Vitreoscilla]AUZ04162.2 transcriptional regulator [Vitreoscilla sp. C1]UOO92072.1 response regulator [Vitreoscilla stercoraria]